MITKLGNDYIGRVLYTDSITSLEALVAVGWIFLECHAPEADARLLVRWDKDIWANGHSDSNYISVWADVYDELCAIAPVKEKLGDEDHQGKVYGYFVDSAPAVCSDCPHRPK